jgi:CHAT domain-containing protein/tetratricopeptide (TPR) repeat protein
VANRRMVRCLAVALVAGLVWGIVAPSAAWAQQGGATAAPNDPARRLGDLIAEVNRLFAEKKYVEGKAAAREMFALAEQILGPEHEAIAKLYAGQALLTAEHKLDVEAEPLFLRSLAVKEKALGPEHRDVEEWLNVITGFYLSRNQYAKSAEFAKRRLDNREQVLGPEDPEVGKALTTLALLYHQMGRYAEAESLLRRSLAIAEKGSDDFETALLLNHLASALEEMGRYAEAESNYKRSLAIREKGRGPDHPDVGQTINQLAGLYNTQGRYPEAEVLYRRALAIAEKSLGPDFVATALHNLGTLYMNQGRYADAESGLRRGLALREKALGPGHPQISHSLNGLASLFTKQGRYAEAEQLYKRSLSIVEKALGLDSPGVGSTLNGLASLYSAQQRYAEAEPLLKRSLAIREKALGPDHHHVAQALNDLALVYYQMDRYAEALPLYVRSLQIVEKAMGPNHPNVATALSNLSSLHSLAKRFDDAEAMLKRSLAIREALLGPDNPDLSATLNQMGLLSHDQGRDAEAEAFFRRSLAIGEKAHGLDHPEVGTVLNNMAMLAMFKGDLAAAAGYWRRRADGIKRRAERGFAESRGTVFGKEALRSRSAFLGLLKISYRQGSNQPTTTGAAEMFETAQWAQGSEAAASLTEMAVRSAAGSPQLAGLVRERQDLVSEWQAKDKLLLTAKSEAPEKRKVTAETALSDRLTAIDTRLAEIDQKLVQEFPDYAALARLTPLPIAEVQALLGSDEALVLLLDTEALSPLPEETFVWVVTKSDVRWVRSDMGTAALAREVVALRCGLDAAAWEGTGAEGCAKAAGAVADKQAPQPLPFDHARANKLYATLFGEVQDLIKGKHLLIVPSGPLTQLPFQALVTEAPGPSDRAAAWLVRAHAVTILPAVASLKALRRISRPSSAPRPMIGFGNPLLDGPDPGFAARAQLARERQRCPERTRRQTVSHIAPRGGVNRIELRGGRADLRHIKMQVPLPETADELCAVARDVKAEAHDIRLGAQASEREIKRLSASGDLAKYRMVHFATHGALAGQLDGTREPGLILTPPDAASAEDDGYLAASEIASLKLDADWVILSACNTAAGAAPNAEALSGLARAFIYAQARALLVSHWAVDSDATVRLVTGAVREMSRDAKVGRAEALRRAMLALIDHGAPHEVHPAYWAPFVVVGEGGAGR